jgi:hypothetical protein
MTTWLDPLSPAVRAAVVSGFWGKSPHSPHWAAPPADPDEIDVIADVLAQASDILTNLTGGQVHPALQVVEEFVCYPEVARLSPSLQPLRRVVGLQSVLDDGSLAGSVAGAVAFGGNVRFTSADHPSVLAPDWLDLSHLWFMQMHCACPELQRLRLTYDAGSTITASARAAVLALAHELYLRVAPCDECGSCRLPTRTTSVTREGISFEVGDPLDATGSARGMTGLPDVDSWLIGFNPRRVGQASAVYTADAPPPVVRSLVTVREVFPPLQMSGVAAAATVTAAGSVS